MSREFQKTTDWIYRNFDNTEYALQTGWNLYLNEMERRRRESNGQHQ